MTKFCRTTPFIHSLKFYRSNMITGLIPRWYVFPSIIWHPRASNWSGRRPFSVPWQHNKCITESISLLLRSGKWTQIPWLKIFIFLFTKTLFNNTLSSWRTILWTIIFSSIRKHRDLLFIHINTARFNDLSIKKKVPCLWRKYLICYLLQTSWTIQCWS